MKRIMNTQPRRPRQTSRALRAWNRDADLDPWHPSQVNTRVGADLACDVPRPRARALFSKLDSIWDDIPAPSALTTIRAGKAQSTWADEME